MDEGSTPGEGAGSQDVAREGTGTGAGPSPARAGESAAAGPADATPDFAAQYGAHTKDVFREAVNRDLGADGDAAARAREYAERGKPDFVLAYLLAGDLPDAEKRALYARSFERRAKLTEERADDFDRRFHRPFPLLRLEATKDRATARRIREGGGLRPGLGRPLPTL